jgi:hypothetical protein
LAAGGQKNPGRDIAAAGMEKSINEGPIQYF